MDIQCITHSAYYPHITRKEKIWIFTAHKRSLRRLCFYTCLSVCGGCLGPNPGGRLGGLGVGCVHAHTQGGGVQAHTRVGGCPGPYPGGVSRPTPGGCPGPGGVSQHALRQTPPTDGYCCGRYASYWNELLQLTPKWFWLYFVELFLFWL